MSRWERYGRRSLVFSKWHRFYLGADEPLIDLDGIEYCGERGCSKPLALLETARDVGQCSKPTTVLRELARQAGGLLALCVLYTVDSAVDIATGCACTPDTIDYGCPHGVVSFRVRKVWPRPTGWTVMTPEDFRRRLREVRTNHIAAEHTPWEAPHEPGS